MKIRLLERKLEKSGYQLVRDGKVAIAYIKISQRTIQYHLLSGR